MIVSEQISGYIESLDEGMPQWLYDLEQKALSENVPIIRRASQNLLRFILRTHKPKRILELGTAVGFSALFMNEYARDAKITTIEKVQMRLVQAKKNLEGKENITLLVGDAIEVIEALSKKNEQFDFIFLDAAKAQYVSYLPYLMKLLCDGGILLTDNVLLEGSIAQSKYAIVRRDRTVHMRMREYLYLLTHTQELETVVLPIADGMAVSVKKTEVTK